MSKRTTLFCAALLTSSLGLTAAIVTETANAKETAEIVAKPTTPKLRFENVFTQDAKSMTFNRAKVPGGWLVTSTLYSGPKGYGITFVPDPNHAWDGSSVE
ncbi:hypothetical protein [Planctomycetes bacterium K23_9]|uniref:Uncharacterized protein n=1 Tax=Stieleria marina TaxID=1930275 RepID=A0A517NV59_9BACT|nr:hypothetical protein K239x_29950 [Planctomycetes bacterium K23_9]